MMHEAVLVDLVHGCPRCTGFSLQDESGSNPLVFLLSRDTGGSSDACLNSTAESLYKLKQTMDHLDLRSVRVFTTPQGREVLLQYLAQIFTSVYNFDYEVKSHLTCPSYTRFATYDSPADDVTKFVQRLPALKGSIRVLTSTLIPDCFGHGFSTRTGGVSSVPTQSALNLFCNQKKRDPVAMVMENKRRLAAHAGFPHQSLRMVKVAHDSDVWVLGGPEPESYDAMVTNQRGAVLAAPGADCMPLLFADPVSEVIGVAHAGYKGTLKGVAMATVNAMVREFGCHVSDILVVVGPSVGACCFTLERGEALDFIRIHPDCVPDPESAMQHVNIRLANRLLLQRGGVLPEHIHDDITAERPSVTPCTSCHPEEFFSHVRDGPNFGIQVGYLWIRKTL